MRRVFLHVGTMKSATSYLQALCNCNVHTLADLGLLWPWTDTNFLAISDLLGTGEARPGVAGAWSELKDRLDAWNGDVLISNELLAAKRPPKIRRVVEALAPAEVHVIITARDLARAIPSQWQTAIRNGDTHRFADFVSDLTQGTEHLEVQAFWRRQDLAAIVRRFSRSVPQDRISVVTVPPSGTDHAVMGHRFLSVLGVEAEQLAQPVRSNSSLGAHSAEVIRRLNDRVAHFDGEQYRWAFKTGLSRLVLSERSSREPPIELSREALIWAQQRARQMVDDLAASGIKVVGDLADLVPVVPGLDRSPDAVPEEAMSSDRGSDDGVEAATLLEVSLDALAGMGEVLSDLRIEHEALVDALIAQLGPDQQAAIEAEIKASYVETRGDPSQAHLLRTRLVRRHVQDAADSGQE